MYAMPEFIRSLYNIKAANPEYDIDILIVDNSELNSKGTKYVEWLQHACDSTNIKLVHLDIENYELAPIHNRIAVSCEWIRKYLLDNKYDLLYNLECDCIASPSSLSRMLAYMESNSMVAVQAAYYEGYTYKRFQTEKFWLTGVCLFKSSIFDNIKFRFDPEQLNGLPDAFLGIDMQQAGLVIGFCPNVFAIHLSDGKLSNLGRPGNGWQNL